jgi:hypothetical protein
MPSAAAAAAAAPMSDNAVLEAVVGVIAEQHPVMAAALNTKYITMRVASREGPICTVRVSCKYDSRLVELAKTCGFPRGFAILYNTAENSVTYHGFLGKFENDDKEDTDKDFKDAVRATFSLKLSGSLIIAFFDVTGRLYVVTKNGEHPMFVDPATEIIRRFMTPALKQRMIDESITLCGEFMFKGDQVHGARVLQDTFACTAISQSRAFPSPASKNGPLEFFGHDKMAAMCAEHGIPTCESFSVTGNEACLSALKELSAVRDFATCTMVIDILTRHGVSNGVSDCSTVRHQDVLGEVLEGLVIFITDADGEVHIVKFKLPNYTHRTFCLRDAIKRGCLQPHAFEQALMAYAKRWVLTPVGGAHWIRYLKACSVAHSRDTVSETNSVDEPAYHIRLSDHVNDLSDSAKAELASAFDALIPKQPAGGKPTVVVVVGPIGAGKSTIAARMCEQHPGHVHVDGDGDGFEGADRADITIGHVINVLNAGSTPVLSTGGGVLFQSTFGKNAQLGPLLLLDRIRRVFGVEFDLILVVVDPSPEAAPATLAVDPSELIAKLETVYGHPDLVVKTAEGRVARGVWAKATTVPTKVAANSGRNIVFSSALAGVASRCFLVRGTTTGVLDESVSFEAIIDCNVPPPHGMAGASRACQGRIPVSFLPPSNTKAPPTTKHGHVTCFYSKKGNTVPFSSFLESPLVLGELGVLVTLELVDSTHKPAAAAAKVSLLLVDVVSDDSASAKLRTHAHVTVCSGMHKASCMRDVALALHTTPDADVVLTDETQNGDARSSTYRVVSRVQSIPMRSYPAYIV